LLSNDSEWNRVVEAESTVKVKTPSDTSVLLIAELKSANFSFIIIIIWQMTF